MVHSTKPPWQLLLETGSLVQFRTLDTYTEAAPDRETAVVRAELVFVADDDETDPADVAEWGALGFLYTLAALSFNDARPRGFSERDYAPTDEFGVSDFFECLRYRQDGLHLSADYIRGRCLKTDITVRPDGTVTLQTWGRGGAALRWLDRLQGKRMMAPV